MSLGDLIAKLFGLDRGMGMDELAGHLGIEQEALRSASISYRTFSIPKRSGGKRKISAPSPDLKQLQRRILRRLLGRLKTHWASTGFERGHSIVTNAVPHTGRAVVLRMDIKDFFPSTSAKRVQRYFRKIGWNRDVARRLCDLCTWHGGLPQGAPTSPRLSNLVNHVIDARLTGIAKARGAVYTRYADDMTFSFDRDDAKAIHMTILAAKAILRECGYTLHHGRKLRIRRRHDRQLVTGLVVNDKPNLPRSIRRRLRAIEHRLATGRKATLTRGQLTGWRALQQMVEVQSRRL